MGEERDGTLTMGLLFPLAPKHLLKTRMAQGFSKLAISTTVVRRATPIINGSFRLLAALERLLLPEAPSFTLSSLSPNRVTFGSVRFDFRIAGFVIYVQEFM